YTIPAEYASNFEELAAQLYVDDYNECNHFLKHKTTMISPSVLLQHNIPVYTAIQEEGEFVITLPNVYHAGCKYKTKRYLFHLVNHGFNIAEAANFALQQWVSYAKEGNDEYCTCRKHVWNFDMDELEKACKG